ncbi:16S rRNA (cytosine(1402)-N(4))-methyltransferase [Candidatus Falkowbacteria bacterium RIFCSPLOWO2_02_FULL_45_15]|uniref:Ribosomal RNA small subunit methyltransferase H n=1 Tax=Candidatus Falkowbacteria bacterium RIFCSPLOWO2_02_FULL_45_15 TaxID=1797988 RepID=A0A1F5RY41_9BACT|nr:MAG: 16S rRNA (cytosine(1402)-N(4))-methyltransferase [Candidatus Falkowbacteria bacterium RIFCSPLOWO2_02_FULL_45_15]
MSYHHTPVMLPEVIEYLNPKTGEIIIDCTLGGAGYTLAIAQRVGEKGKVIAIDADEMAIENAKGKIENEKLSNIILVNENFKNLSAIINQIGLEKVDGVVFDLGLSSAQLEDATRGFSFNSAATLNMEFGSRNQGSGIRNTEEIVNKFKPEELEKIIREYGEERFAKKIVGAIIKARRLKPIANSRELAAVISQAVPAKYRYGRIHPATRTFQALRIATNDELTNLKVALPQAAEALAAAGRIVIISYHSLEDRIVKWFLRERQNQGAVKILTKKVVTATKAEMKNNPRARSAKLRAAVKK